MFVLVVIVTFWAFLFTRFIFFSSVEPFIVAVGMLTFYLFLSWNTSNDLGSSYVPFTAIMISTYQMCINWRNKTSLNEDNSYER
jgi:hypothetical protein